MSIAVRMRCETCKPGFKLTENLCRLAKFRMERPTCMKLAVKEVV